nr:alanine racemase [Propioniciclava soli]
MDANVERVAAWADARAVALRPHVKTHKSPEIAHRQVEAGAHGITVATLGEAEVFVQDGFDDLFVAYPLWVDDDRRRRLVRLCERAAVRVGFDSLDAARRLAGTGAIGVVEIDSGHHRTGVAPDAAGELAARAQDAGLTVAGVFTFPGHSYGLGAREAAAAQEAEALASAAASLRAAGVEPDVISGGSTPSLAAAGEGATELRPGVYVFNDAQQWELGACAPEQIALTCHATVVSHAGGRLVLDAGSKALGADRAAWASGFGRLLDFPDARIVLLSEHHAVADLGGAALPALGSTVRLVPNHACNAANLAEEFVIVHGGEPVDTWAVSARGMNS